VISSGAPRSQQQHQPLRPAQSSARSYAINLDSAREEQQYQQALQASTRSHSSQHRQPRPASAQLSSSSALRATGATPVGVTLVPTTVYRPASGTMLNKVPYSARVRDQLARDQLETRERLRAKALDKRIKEAVMHQELSMRTAQAGRAPSKRLPGSGKPKRRAQSARRAPLPVQNPEEAYLSQRELEYLQQPFQSAHNDNRPPSAYQVNSQRGQQSQVLLQAQGLASPSSSSSQRPKWGPAHEPADRPGQHVSSSAQSRLSASELAVQPVAGMPSGSFGKGNDLAKILGGGHEFVVFGNRNAPSATTRVMVPESEAPRSPVPNKTLSLQTRQQQGPGAVHYAPYATTPAQLDERAAPRRFNDDTGALAVRDNLVDEVRHASASIGFGKGHPGWREYLAKPASASMKPEQGNMGALQDPFAASKATGILSWDSSDGTTQGAGGGSRKEELRRLQAKTWSRVPGDGNRFGAAAGQVGLDVSRDDLPVAGQTKFVHEPFRLSYGDEDPRTVYQTEQARMQARAKQAMKRAHHVHGPNCSHASHEEEQQQQQQPQSPQAQSSEQQQQQQSTKRSTSSASSGISALGFGRSHPAYKTAVLAQSANLEVAAAGYQKKQQQRESIEKRINH
jgi:hypothetical protein